jgi:hypothetical protein
MSWHFEEPGRLRAFAQPLRIPRGMRFAYAVDTKTARSHLGTLCIALFAALSCTAAQAQDTTADRQRAMLRYMQVAPMSKMMDDAYAELAKRMPADQRAGFTAQLKRVVRVEAVEAATQTALVKHFTADELNALADFYGSKHGASAMAKFGAYMADVIPPLMTEIQRGMRDVQNSPEKR